MPHKQVKPLEKFEKLFPNRYCFPHKIDADMAKICLGLTDTRHQIIRLVASLFLFFLGYFMEEMLRSKLFPYEVCEGKRK